MVGFHSQAGNEKSAFSLYRGSQSSRVFQPIRNNHDEKDAAVDSRFGTHGCQLTTDTTRSSPLKNNVPTSAVNSSRVFQKETPIQKDIRIAQEREDQLHLERYGSMAGSKHVDSSPVITPSIIVAVANSTNSGIQLDKYSKVYDSPQNTQYSVQGNGAGTLTSSGAENEPEVSEDELPEVPTRGGNARVMNSPDGRPIPLPRSILKKTSPVHRTVCFAQLETSPSSPPSESIGGMTQSLDQSSFEGPKTRVSSGAQVGRNFGNGVDKLSHSFTPSLPNLNELTYASDDEDQLESQSPARRPSLHTSLPDIAEAVRRCTRCNHPEGDESQPTVVPHSSLVSKIPSGDSSTGGAVEERYAPAIRRKSKIKQFMWTSSRNSTTMPGHVNDMRSRFEHLIFLGRHNL